MTDKDDPASVTIPTDAAMNDMLAFLGAQAPGIFGRPRRTVASTVFSTALMQYAREFGYFSGARRGREVATTESPDEPTG